MLSNRERLLVSLTLEKSMTEWTERNYGFVWREWGLVARLLPS